jgi:hypothetical protein
MCICREAIPFPLPLLTATPITFLMVVDLARLFFPFLYVGHLHGENLKIFA